MPIEVKVAGVWQADAAPEVKVSGVWNTCSEVNVKVAGVWETAYSGLSVSIDVNGRTNWRENLNCFGGAAFYTSGVNYEITASASYSSVGNWLDSGTASDVWIQWVRTGGTLSAWNSINPGTGRVMWLETQAPGPPSRHSYRFARDWKYLEEHLQG